MRRGLALGLAALAVAACTAKDHAPIATAPSQPEATTTSTTAAPGFRAAVEALSAADLPSSWREGCPVAVEDLRAIDATHWGFDGEVHDGRIVVAAERTTDVVGILRDLFDAGYPIERMEPVDDYGGDDIASVLANNTSAFNCRFATGSANRWSEHAYGRAVDLNPLVNPYVTSAGVVIPAESAPYLDRGRDDQGMVRDGDPAVVAFEARGWVWGGDWSSARDYQHFSTTGR